MKKIIYLLIGLMACTETTEIPENVLNKGKMTTLLMEIHILESKINQTSYAQFDSSLIAYATEEAKLLKKYKTDTASFNRSYAFYAQHPKLLEEIYTVVIDSLSYRESLAKAETTRQNQIDNSKMKNRVDSVKKIIPKIKDKKVK